MDRNVIIHRVLSCEEVSISEIAGLLSGNGAVIYIVNTGNEEFQIKSLEYLTDIQKQKMYSYIKENDKRNYFIAHSIINYIFSTILKCEVKSLQHKTGKYKKPYIVNNCGYYYNISHSGNYSVVAMHKGEIGTDIECVNRNFEFGGIMRGQFCEADIKYVGEDLKKFFKLWVAKEAYFKYIGTGLYRQLKSISFANEADGYILIYDKESKKEQPVFLMEEDEYLLGVCVD